MYDKNAPLFPFGYGLTYTDFKYSNLKLSKNSLRSEETVDVTFTIQNAGNYDSDEVTQLYVSFPGSNVERPVKSLKGFKRVFVKKGETARITITLKANDLMYWNTDQQKWTLEPGKISCFIGPSSADAKLSGELTIK
jgi:beta-glucosidase